MVSKSKADHRYSMQDFLLIPWMSALSGSAGQVKARGRVHPTPYSTCAVQLHLIMLTPVARVPNLPTIITNRHR